jgi:hypothetical protein
MLNAAASKTLESNHDAAEAYSKLGAGQKGGSNYVHIPELPESGTIPGVSHEKTYMDGLNIYNQARANSSYDKFIHAQPRIVPVGGAKRKLRTKKRHGRRRNRTHRRKHRRNSRSSRRSRRSLV